jgi:hypothetical protein
LEQEGNAYRLRLLLGMNIRLVFLPDKLRKAAEDLLPDQIVTPPGAIKIDSEDE